MGRGLGLRVKELLLGCKLDVKVRDNLELLFVKASSAMLVEIKAGLVLLEWAIRNNISNIFVQTA